MFINSEWVNEYLYAWSVKVFVTQSCLTVCDPLNCGRYMDIIYPWERWISCHLQQQMAGYPNPLYWIWNENWLLPVLWPLLSFPNLLTRWVRHFNSIYLQIVIYYLIPSGRVLQLCVQIVFSDPVCYCHICYFYFCYKHYLMLLCLLLKVGYFRKLKIRKSSFYFTLNFWHLFV